MQKTASWNQAQAEKHRIALGQTLKDKGFGDYAKIQFDPDAPASVPLAFVTGVNTERFNPDKHFHTETKSTIAVGNELFILNQSAAVIPQILSKGNHEIVVQVKPQNLETVKRALSETPGAERIHYIASETSAPDLTEKFYHAAANISLEKPLSRVDLVLYESFAAGVNQPFKPIYEEDSRVVGEAVSKRASFFHAMCMIAFDLLENNDHQSLRVIALTALAARRVGGNLLADAAHKQISTNYLETFARESAFYYPDRKIHCVEIAPGIVDNGIYDNKDARVATIERAAINGFGFDSPEDCEDSVLNIPKLSPDDIGFITAQYMLRAEGQDFHDILPDKIQTLAKAGREESSLSALAENAFKAEGNSAKVTNDLPSWGLTPGTELGRFPALRKGYQFVPICPRGQYF